MELTDLIIGLAIAVFVWVGVGLGGNHKVPTPR